MKAKQRVIELEYKMVNWRELSKIQRENLTLKKRLEHIEADIDPPLRWILSVAEDTFNVDAHNILEKFRALEKEYEQYKSRTEKEIDELWEKLSKCRKHKNEYKDNLRKISEEVVQPMIQQVTKREKEFQLMDADQK